MESGCALKQCRTKISKTMLQVFTNAFWCFCFRTPMQIARTIWAFRREEDLCWKGSDLIFPFRFSTICEFRYSAIRSKQTLVFSYCGALATLCGMTHSMRIKCLALFHSHSHFTCTYSQLWRNHIWECFHSFYILFELNRFGSIDAFTNSSVTSQCPVLVSYSRSVGDACELRTQNTINGRCLENIFFVETQIGKKKDRTGICAANDLTCPQASSNNCASSCVLFSSRTTRPSEKNT